MLNNVSLMGRLTDNPVLNQTRQSGALVTSFSIAIDRRFKRQGEERQTDFINCVAWQKTAEFISKYFNKGDMIAITGEIQTRKYEDAEGKPRTATEVIINNAYFCGSKNSEAAAPVNNNVDDLNNFDDDLPF